MDREKMKALLDEMVKQSNMDEIKGSDDRDRLKVTLLLEIAYQLRELNKKLGGKSSESDEQT